MRTRGPSSPDDGYERRSRFDEAKGFVPLEEIHGLEEHNPRLVRFKRV